MNASKILTSAVVAASLVGGIGFAYAQSSGEGAPTTDMSQPAAQPANQPSLPSQSSTPANTATPMDSSTPSELAPHADRN